MTLMPAQYEIKLDSLPPPCLFHLDLSISRFDEKLPLISSSLLPLLLLRLSFSLPPISSPVWGLHHDGARNSEQEIARVWGPAKSTSGRFVGALGMANTGSREQSTLLVLYEPDPSPAIFPTSSLLLLLARTLSLMANDIACFCNFSIGPRRRMISAEFTLITASNLTKYLLNISL